MCVSFWFLVIFSHVNQWQSVKWANKYKILILNSHFRLRKLRSSYQGTKNVAIYAFSLGKIENFGNLTGVCLWPMSMSLTIHWGCSFITAQHKTRHEKRKRDIVYNKTLPKTQRTRGLSSSFQSNLLGHITSSNANLDQTSSSKSRPCIYFKIPTKHQHLD